MEDVNWKMFVAPIIILFVFIGGIIGIVNWQKSKKDTSPIVNELTVSIPEGQVESDNKEITVSGSAADSDQVFINDSEVQIDKDGNYSKSVVLEEGDNTILIQSKKDGNEVASVERTVTYSPATAATEVVSTPPVSQPTAGAPSPVSPAPANLATSGPEEIIIPIVGFGGVILAIAYYTRSKKTLTLSLRK